MSALTNYAWPGNIRELRNVIERSLITCRQSRLELDDLPPTLGDADIPAPSISRPGSLKQGLESAEKQIIADTLKYVDNNRTAAAKILGIHRTGLHKKIRKYGL